MSAHRSATAEPGAPLGLDMPRTFRSTWLGLAVAGMGWALLLGSAGVGDVVAVRIGRPPSPTLHGDIADIAKCLVGSGFGLAILGSLQTGFGTLHRFFATVLDRSAQRATATAHMSETSKAPHPEEPVVDRRDAEALRERRPYQVLSDGSVEVETIVGTRRFVSMREARDFI